MSRHVLGFVALSTLIACSGGAGGGTADGGASSSSSSSSGGEDPAPSGSSSSSSGTSETCVPRVAPESATPTSAFELDFTSFTAADAGDGWRVIGHDRDEQCSTATTAPVCRRAPGATAESQIDGADGIDNAFGHTVIPLLKRYTSTNEYSGKIVVSATGAGRLSLALTGGRTLDVPLAFVKLERNGASVGMLSALVKTDELVSNVQKVAGVLSKALCTGDAIDALVQSIRQASDIGDGGPPDPSRDCSHVSLGGVLSGLRPSQPLPPPNVPPDPCTSR